MHVKSDSCLVVGKIPLPPFSPKLTRSVATEATRRPLVFSAMLSASNRRASATSGLSSSSFNASLNSNKFRATFGDRSSRRKPTPGRSPPPGCTTPYASGVASHLDFRVKAGTKSISPPRHSAVPPRNVSRSSIPSPPRAKNDAKTSIALGRLSMEDRNGIGENFSAEAERTSTSSSKNGVLPSPTNSSGSSSEEKNEEKNRQNSSVQKTDQSPIVDKPPSSVMDENLFEEKNEMGILPKTTRDIGFSPTADKSVQFGSDSITSNISVEKPERLKTKFYPSPPPMKRGSSLGEGLDTKPDKISHSSQKHFSKEFKDSSINEKRRRCIASVNFFPEEGILQPNLEPSVSPSNQENVWSREKWEENVGNVRKLIERRRKHKCDKRHCSRNVDEQEPVRRDSRNSEVQTYPDDLRRISGEKRHSRKSSHNGVSAKVADEVADTKKREKRKDSKPPEEVAVLPSRKKESIVNEIVHKDTPFGEWRSGEEPIKNDKIACGSAESAGKVTMENGDASLKDVLPLKFNRLSSNSKNNLAELMNAKHGKEVVKNEPEKRLYAKKLARRKSNTVPTTEKLTITPK
ncbi:unnamed protein product [Nesidiocoris tenuis]|uniref:Uncharacterized protein n=1 Tax=Nesidiocoris tenuis TaxID=355587 RepID=A0A6H5GT25_9HEMI|nr:unnamed protein product [Nesidiocoris tenuis]